MKVFVIPSWYPSQRYPSTGIFIREQAKAMAQHRPDWKVGLSLWGSHEPGLWVPLSTPLDSLIKLGSRPPIRKFDRMLGDNCVEFFTPAFTWTRRLLGGNLKGIIKANEQNLKRFEQNFGQPDVIHAHVAHPAGVVASHLSRKYRIPYVITEHMSPFPMESYRWDYKRTLLPPLRRADQVFAVSEALVDRLGSFGVDAIHLANFIDDQYFLPEEKDPSQTSLIAVGRLEKQKNYELMLHVYAELKNRRPKITLKVIGSGSLERRLKKLADTLDVHVDWLGECDQEQIKYELQQASLFVNTSHHENQPVAILEAMAMGLQVVTTNWAGASELVKGQLGDVVPADKHELTAAILHTVDGPPSRSPVRAAFLVEYGTAQALDKLEVQYKALISLH